MNATADLLVLLAEWRRLTDCESQAILQENWVGLANSQDQKSRLREEITSALDLYRGAHPPTDNAFAEEQRRIDDLGSELMARESRNHDQLDAKRRDRQAKLERLEETLRQLTDLRRAYGISQTTRWQSYS